MDILKPGPESAPDQLRALTSVAAAAENGLSRPQRALLDAIQRLILETDLEIEGLAPIEPNALGCLSLDASLARQLIRLMVVISLAEGPPSKEQMRLMQDFRDSLGVREPAVDVVNHLAKGRLLRFRLSFARRSHVRIYFRNTYRLLGSGWQVFKSILRFRGVLGEDPELASRFRALEHLPQGTLGNHFYRHCSGADLPFSGEKGGFPLGALYHDFTHVLAGYDTTPEGEMKAAAFQAGFTRDEHDFFTALFAIVIHTAGVNLTPFSMPVLRGRIGQDGLALEVVHALERGASMKTDLSEGWDFWEYVDLPIEVVRERLSIPARDSALFAA